MKASWSEVNQLNLPIDQTPQPGFNSDDCSNENSSGEESESEESSNQSIHKKYPNLPAQLKDIVELQNFRI